MGSVEAVNNLTVAIRSGELYGPLASNGVGKTTLIKKLGGRCDTLCARTHKVASGVKDARGRRH